MGLAPPPFRDTSGASRDALTRSGAGRGQVIDEVIDWAGIEYVLLRQDKVVATLMALAAETVESGKRSPDYWQVERRWIAGESTEVTRESYADGERALPAS